MRQEWREYFLTWSETEEYRARVLEAKEVIRDTLKQHRAYIAFSGGKDSTVLLHLVMQENRDVLVVNWDYGLYFVPRSLHEEIIENARKIGARNLRVFTSPLYKKLGRNARNVLGRHFLGKVVPELIKEGYTATFIALRAQESVKRRLRTESFREWDKKGILNVYPIRNWTWKDVWAYIISNKVPYLSFYDKYAPLLGYDRVRFTTLFDPEFDKFGSENVDKFLMWRYYIIE